ncbi:cupin domain-containing protein [Bowmanella sp. Y26]|uniref:cupin domain-containing protein n=1 Tax=Bowmanella yangjiangensis TaxID=2811230 RepID=UPI001BDC75A9|nr:cupin domain-containing protein [Bowmanella yangjiangensis]MBT1063173.1 cupin domain-containing protein [Bowmanella yangjiangensis]
MRVLLTSLLAGLITLPLFAHEPTSPTDTSATPVMHPSWDSNNDGINDCEDDGSCDHSVDYSKPRPDGKIRLDRLMSSELAGIAGKEVIISKVDIPAHTELPKHWHPGEEFAYVIKGSVSLWQQGKETLLYHQGDAVKVPLRQVHTAITGAEGVSLIIFRVHQQGQPERVLVEEDM